MTDPIYSRREFLNGGLAAGTLVMSGSSIFGQANDLTSLTLGEASRQVRKKYVSPVASFVIGTSRCGHFGSGRPRASTRFCDLIILMQTQTIDKPVPKVAPYNDVAELIDREVHAKTLEQINVLAREYEIGNPSEVAGFLRENASLLGLLEEIPRQIRKVFGRKQNLILAFFFDPEDPSYHRMSVGIPTTLPVEKSSLLLKKFDDGWWIENERKSRSKILVDLEFIK